MTPDGRHVVSGSYDETLKVWDLERGEELHTLRGHNDPVLAVAMMPDGRHAVSGSGDGTLKLWDLASGEEVQTLRGHAKAVAAVAVTPDGRHAVSGSYDETLKVWDLERGSVVASITGEGWYLACAVAPDGLTIIAGGGSGRVDFLRLEGVEPNNCHGRPGENGV